MCQPCPHRWNNKNVQAYNYAQLQVAKYWAEIISLAHVSFAVFRIRCVQYDLNLSIFAPSHSM